MSKTPAIRKYLDFTSSDDDDDSTRPTIVIQHSGSNPTVKIIPKKGSDDDEYYSKKLAFQTSSSNSAVRTTFNIEASSSKTGKYKKDEKMESNKKKEKKKGDKIKKQEKKPLPKGSRLIVELSNSEDEFDIDFSTGFHRMFDEKSNNFTQNITIRHDGTNELSIQSSDIDGYDLRGKKY